MNNNDLQKIDERNDKIIDKIIESWIEENRSDLHRFDPDKEFDFEIGEIPYCKVCGDSAGALAHALDPNVTVDWEPVLESWDSE